MTAVRGPLVFTSDKWEDRFVTLAKRGNCGSVPVQLGVHPEHAPDLIRQAGMDVLGWGACAGPSVTREWLQNTKPKVWMPQAETTAEFEAMVACLEAHVFAGPIEPVMTSGGMEHPNPANEAEKVKERARRRDLLASFGVTTVWVEVYVQDAQSSGQWVLGNVDQMCSFFRDAFGFKEAHPVIGLWDNVPVSRYVLLSHGRTFGAWRAEQMTDDRYDEIAAVSPIEEAQMTAAEVRQAIAEIAEPYAQEHDLAANTRIALAGRIARLPAGTGTIKDRDWRDKKIGERIAAILDEVTQ